MSHDSPKRHRQLAEIAGDTFGSHGIEKLWGYRLGRAVVRKIYQNPGTSLTIASVVTAATLWALQIEAEL